MNSEGIRQMKEHKKVHLITISIKGMCLCAIPAEVTDKKVVAKDLTVDMDTHRAEAVESRVPVLVVGNLQCIRCYRHLERIGNLHYLAGEIVGSSNACSVGSLLGILD
jgi:hypothetical protein